MLTQIESGVYCPVAMTYGSVTTMQKAPEVAAKWLPVIFKPNYDPRFVPVGEKTGAMIGMGMTENQGGSDLRTNTTRAEPSGDGTFRLFGHKWFLSAPMCDGFMILALAPKGLSCFFMPRFTPDGERNALRINRLKDKLGNKSNASSEVEFDGAFAHLVGEEGRGIPTIIEMSNFTRLDCAIGTSGLMRQMVAQAIHHARHRTAFQKKLIDQPLMTNVLADLALEFEAATVLTMRLARAYDENDEAATVIRRALTPAAKFWICKRAPALAAEAMEVLGGNGYVEESIMPRVYREMPVNSIWEGSGNVMCLDVLRAIERTPKAAEVLRAELDSAPINASWPLPAACSSGFPRPTATTRARRACWCAIWCWRCRRRSWSSIRRRRSPTRSASRGLTARAGPPSACCRAGSTRARWSSAQRRLLSRA